MIAHVAGFGAPARLFELRDPTWSACTLLPRRYRSAPCK